MFASKLSSYRIPMRTEFSKDIVVDRVDQNGDIVVVDVGVVPNRRLHPPLHPPHLLAID